MLSSSTPTNALILVLTLLCIILFKVSYSSSKEVDLPPTLFYKVKDSTKYSPEDLMCLARNIYFEAATESFVGKYAVAQVTLNRVNHYNFPSTICKVVYQPSQFSWTLNKSLHYATPRGANWDESMNVAVQVLYNNTRLSLVDEALFYHATYVNPRWAKYKDFITQIETHIFYKYRDI